MDAFFAIISVLEQLQAYSLRQYASRLPVACKIEVVKEKYIPTCMSSASVLSPENCPRIACKAGATDPPGSKSRDPRSAV